MAPSQGGVKRFTNYFKTLLADRFVVSFFFFLFMYFVGEKHLVDTEPDYHERTVLF